VPFVTAFDAVAETGHRPSRRRVARPAAPADGTLRLSWTGCLEATFSRWTGHEPVLTDGEPVPMPMEESPTASTSTDGVGAPETDTESEAAVDALARA
jgi:hypothetical protein